MQDFFYQLEAYWSYKSPSYSVCTFVVMEQHQNKSLLNCCILYTIDLQHVAIAQILRVAFWTSSTFIIYWVQACARIGRQASAERLDSQYSARPWRHLSFGADHEAGFWQDSSNSCSTLQRVVIFRNTSWAIQDGQIASFIEIRQNRHFLASQKSWYIPHLHHFQAIGKNCLQPSLSIYDRKWSFFFGVPVDLRFQESTVLLWSSGTGHSVFFQNFVWF